MNDYKVGDVVQCDDIQGTIVDIPSLYHPGQYLIEYREDGSSRGDIKHMWVLSENFTPVFPRVQSSTHVENVHAAFTRAQQKEATYDALKDARHFEDAVNADVIRQSAYADFFRAFVRFVNENPQIWETLSK